jgi:small multidrug resistance pump
MKVTDPKVAWICLALAVCFEVVGTTSMKASAGFNSVGYSILMIVCYVASFTLMTFALEVLDLGVAYATWSGVGTTATAIVGVIKFNERLTPVKAVAICSVILSVVFLQIVSGDPISKESRATPTIAQPLLGGQAERTNAVDETNTGSHEVRQ